MSTRSLRAVIAVIAACFVAFFVWTGVALATEVTPTPPVPIPDPRPAPASPNLLPPYAVWESTPITAVTGVAAFDMVIGEDGRLHFAIASGRTGALIYMVGLPGAWITETVAITTGRNHSYPAIALDSSGEPRIAYLVYGSCSDEPESPYGLLAVRYAERSGGAWTSTDVPPNQDGMLCSGSQWIDNRTDLALDGDGQPWIVWNELAYGSSGTTEFSRLASRGAQGKWRHTTLASGQTAFARLAVSPSGEMHAVFSSVYPGWPTRGVLWHRVWRNGVEQSTRLNSGDTVTAYPQIAIDPLGRVFVTGNNSKVFEVTLWRGEGANWTQERLTTAQNINDASAAFGLAIAGDGLPALLVWRSFTQENRFGWNFYWWDGFGWRIEEVEFSFPILVFQFDGNIATAALLDITTGDLALQRRVPVEIEPRARLPLIAR